MSAVQCSVGRAHLSVADRLALCSGAAAELSARMCGAVLEQWSAATERFHPPALPLSHLDAHVSATMMTLRLLQQSIAQRACACAAMRRSQSPAASARRTLIHSTAAVALHWRKEKKRGKERSAAGEERREQSHRTTGDDEDGGHCDRVGLSAAAPPVAVRMTSALDGCQLITHWLHVVVRC